MDQDFRSLKRPEVVPKVRPDRFEIEEPHQVVLFALA